MLAWINNYRHGLVWGVILHACPKVQPCLNTAELVFKQEKFCPLGTLIHWINNFFRYNSTVIKPKSTQYTVHKLTVTNPLWMMFDILWYVNWDNICVITWEYAGYFKNTIGWLIRQCWVSRFDGIDIHTFDPLWCIRLVKFLFSLLKDPMRNMCIRSAACGETSWATVT